MRMVYSKDFPNLQSILIGSSCFARCMTFMVDNCPSVSEFSICDNSFPNATLNFTGTIN